VYNLSTKQMKLVACFTRDDQQQQPVTVRVLVHGVTHIDMPDDHTCWSPSQLRSITACWPAPNYT